jgi:hypothetical protein
VVSQIPGGALADAVTWKRGLVAIGIVMIGTTIRRKVSSRTLIPYAK